MIARRRFLIVAASSLSVAGALALGVLDASPAAAKSPAVYTGIVKGVAVGGYDPVAYFTAGQPVKGNPAISLDHDGAKWYFSTEANRDAFKAEPAKYAPQYGGYCAWAVAQGSTAKGDPTAWSIHEGKLYLNYNQSVRKDWSQNIPANVAKGDANWPKVIEK